MKTRHILRCELHSHSHIHSYHQILLDPTSEYIQNLATFYCSTWLDPSSILIWIFSEVSGLPPLSLQSILLNMAVTQLGPKSAHMPLLKVLQRSPCSLACHSSDFTAFCFALCHSSKNQACPCVRVSAPAFSLPLQVPGKPFSQTLA